MLKRLLRLTLLAVAAVLIALILVIPDARADCTTQCRPDCWPVPGGQRCRTVCHRRCWHTPPPSYSYRAPSSSPTAAVISVPPLLLLGGLGIIVALLAAFATGDSATDEVESATRETERETAETDALIAKLDAAAQEADAHLDRFLSDTRRPPR